MANEAVRVTQHGAVSVITLNRPEKLNAIDDTLLGGLSEALLAAERDASVRVVAITGAGRGFCAGGDLDTLAQLKTHYHSANFGEFLKAGHDVIRKVCSLAKIVVASINGPAAGAGMNLALACDLRIASERASLSQAFIRLGLHPDWGGTFLLPRVSGLGRALEMFTLGEALTAEEAHRWGLVNFLVPHSKLAEETLALAGRLAAAPALPLALLKQAFYERIRTELDTVLRRELEAQMKCFSSEDLDEGLRAFREKRAPKFGEALTKP